MKLTQTSEHGDKQTVLGCVQLHCQIRSQSVAAIADRTASQQTSW